MVDVAVLGVSLVLVLGAVTLFSWAEYWRTRCHAAERRAQETQHELFRVMDDYYGYVAHGRRPKRKVA